MSEVIIFPEMLQAGMEALAECEARDLEDQDKVVAVYLAMQAIYKISLIREKGAVH